MYLFLFTDMVQHEHKNPLLMKNVSDTWKHISLNSRPSKNIQMWTIQKYLYWDDFAIAMIKVTT